MRIFISIITPLFLLFLGIWYSFKIHKRYLLRWRYEFTFNGMLLHAFPTFVKSIVIMFLIIFIHNSFHNDYYYELLLFVSLFFVFSIFQSPYSLGGFLTRTQNIAINSKYFFKDKSTRADNFIDKIIAIFNSKGELAAKLLILLGFIVVFIPNITLFVTSNIVYFLLIFLLIGLSLILNNVIFFGFVSLMIFQYDPVSLSFTNINWIVFIASYIVILVGLSLENKLEEKMLMIISVMEVKRFNFKLGYTTVFDKPKVVVYQNNTHASFRIH